MPTQVLEVLFAVDVSRSSGGADSGLALVRQAVHGLRARATAADSCTPAASFGLLTFSESTSFDLPFGSDNASTADKMQAFLETPAFSFGSMTWEGHNQYWAVINGDSNQPAFKGNGKHPHARTRTHTHAHHPLNASAWVAPNLCCVTAPKCSTTAL